MRNRLYLAVVALLLGAWTMASCDKDKGNYEAEIEWIQFATQEGRDRVQLLGDTIKQSSGLDRTDIVKELPHTADLSQLKVIYKLSPGAHIEGVQSGDILDFTEPRQLRVVSENGANIRTYTFTLSKLDAPPVVDLGPKLSPDAMLENFAIDGVEPLDRSQRGTRIRLIVKEDVDLTQLVPRFTISEKATANVEPGQAHDFSEGPLVVIVTSEDKSAQSVWFLSVSHPDKNVQSGATIESFRFAGSTRLATIEGSRIYYEAEPQLDITRAEPIYRLSKGATCDLTIGEWKDFTKEVVVTVTSADGTATSRYTVMVDPFRSSEAELKGLQLEGIGDAVAVGGNEWLFGVAGSKSLSQIRYSSITMSKGATCNWGSAEAWNFSSGARDLVVTSQDGLHKRTYKVRVRSSGEPYSGTILSSFGFKNLNADIAIKGTDIYCVVPPGSDLTKLRPTFTYAYAWWAGPRSVWLYGPDGSKYTIDGKYTIKIDKDGGTAIDFTQRDSKGRPNVLRSYRDAAWVYYSDYTVHFIVSNEISPMPTLKSFSLLGLTTPQKPKGNTLRFTVDEKVDVSSLTPVFEVSKGAKVEGLTTNVPADFSKELTLTLKSEDDLQVTEYKIIVEKRLNDRAELLDLRLEGLQKPAQAGNTFTFFGGSGVDASSLTAQFTLSKGAKATTQHGDFLPGQAYNLTQPLQVRVQSEDGNIVRVYTIVVDQRLNFEAELLRCTVEGASEDCKIDGTKVTFEPAGVNLSNARIEFEASPGASVTREDGSPLESGSTVDLSKPFRLKITSEDKSITKTYTVRQAVKGLRFDFERWNQEDGYMHPKGGWSSSNPGMAVAKQFTGKPDWYPVYRTSDSHSGQYAATIETVEFGKYGRSLAAGALFLGSFNGNVVISDPEAAPQFGVFWPGHQPDRFTGWYKYRPGATRINTSGSSLGGQDTFSLYAILYHGETLNGKNVSSSSNIIAEARLDDCTARGEWTRFDLEFVYKKEIPEGADLKYSIVLSSSSEGASTIGAIGSKLIVDDFEITLK
ncbi:MAG: hypothetical protein CSA07_05335 [Bacteroidia bacterium]|nr:MAG: hypothetical protein CSA07_05335 [Bacteroidia bacterium]